MAQAGNPQQDLIDQAEAVSNKANANRSADRYSTQSTGLVIESNGRLEEKLDLLGDATAALESQVGGLAEVAENLDRRVEKLSGTIEQSEKTAKRFNAWILVFTVILVVLTITLVGLTFVLLKKTH